MDADAMTLPTARTRIPIEKGSAYPTPNIWRPEDARTQTLYASMDIGANVYIDLPAHRHGEDALAAIDDLIVALHRLRAEVKAAQDARCGQCDAPLIFGRHLPCRDGREFCGTRDCHPFVAMTEVQP